ncbi:hypothetical protein SAMN04487968_112119 [Nocardioides terrae]|uniref:Uncharacterized protein n=1 Tax=Nocardioides terrae TaxID=574651 RepID=A0A1I1MK25_9ACTN|nr:hypothetical protein [Nocardioides terrae]SFC85192.1 hypothetical protein SAMN04487968_112119 [Nocardioides terrae]
MQKQLEWSAPRGFLAFDTSDVSAEWCARTAEEIAPGNELFAADLAGAVTRCLERDADPQSWLVVIAEHPDQPPRIVATGDLEVGPALDVAEMVRSWTDQLAELGPRAGEATLVPSRRAPAAVLRMVELVTDDDGGEHYVETGKILKTFPRLGVTGAISVSARSLVTFGDLTELLKEASTDFEITEAAHG